MDHDPHVNSTAGAPGAGHRDALTAALPRSFLVAMLEREVVEADAVGKRFAVCLLDVDELRRVNERAGFRVGDSVLAAVAEAAREELRRPRWRNMPSAVGRYDGDALAVLLRCGDREALLDFGRAVSAAVAGSEFTGSTRVKLSVAAVVYELGENTDALLARLERTLHLVKQIGEVLDEVAPQGGWERAGRTLTVVRGAGAAR
jgi:diguanylate cyclase (GGDEF)-like protein